MKTKKEKVPGQSCDINFGKFKDRSVKVYVGDKQIDGVEIIGSRGKYAINADSSNEKLSTIRGKSGNLKEVKKTVSSYLCGMQNEQSVPEMGDVAPSSEPVIQNQNSEENGE